MMKPRFFSLRLAAAAIVGALLTTLFVNGCHTTPPPPANPPPATTDHSKDGPLRVGATPPPTITHPGG